VQGGEKEVKSGSDFWVFLMLDLSWWDESINVTLIGLGMDRSSKREAEQLCSEENKPKYEGVTRIALRKLGSKLEVRPWDMS
jgi:hypothetical protein